jgi:hypothetical protein
MVTESANSFISAYGCGGSYDNVCERRDLPHKQGSLPVLRVAIAIDAARGSGINGLRAG